VTGALPRYPVYVLSKGRSDRCLTARFLLRDGVPFIIAVEPHEADLYAAEFGRERLLILPFRDAGTATPARNAVKERSVAAGDARHWQLDDNIRGIRGYVDGKRVRVRGGPALREVEELVDGYENVGIAGLQHTVFQDRSRPFLVNRQVYSCVLVDNRLPFRWRGVAHHDTDYSLQVLVAGHCTILVCAFGIEKAQTMSMKGGMTDAYLGDGKLRKAHEIQRRWPGRGIKIVRRNGVPSASMGRVWSKFTTPLRPRSP